MPRIVRLLALAALVSVSLAAGWGARGLTLKPPPIVFPGPSRPCAPPVRELPLEVQPAPPPRPPRKAVADGVRHVRVSDDIPAWVPESAIYRYTIVESSTIAENLGLLPLGTAAAHPDWTFDVVALIEAERAGHPVCPPGQCATPADVPADVFAATVARRGRE